MREIKFRAWDKDGEQMITERGFINIHDSNCFEIFIESIGEWKTDNLELMQYTGLKDKNGVEIYEGDIVKTNEHIDYVEWKEDFSAFKYHKDKSNLSLLQWFEHGQYAGTEVIGNIYENPELLGGKDGNKKDNS